MLPALYDFLKSQRDPMLQTLRTLVEHETPTDDKAAIDRAQEYVSGEFDALGGSVQVLPQTEAGDHLRVEFAGVQEPQLTLLTHIDELDQQP